MVQAINACCFISKSFSSAHTHTYTVLILFARHIIVVRRIMGAGEPETFNQKVDCSAYDAVH